MKQLGEAAADVAAEKKRERHRRFQWCRLENGFFDKALWRVVSEMIGLPLYQVQAFCGRLECLANMATPRGSVEDFRPGEFAAACGMSIEDAARIYAALEHPDVAWIEQDHVVSFYARNPDKEDATSNERDRRRKARIAVRKELKRREASGSIVPEQREGVIALLGVLADVDLFALRDKLSRGVALEAALSTATPATPWLSVAHRDSVAATPRAEQTTSERTAVDNSGTASRGEEEGPSEDGDRGQGGDPQEAARLWIESEGLKLLVERMEWPLTRASMMMARWLDQNIAGDAAALATILQVEEARGYIGPRFHTNVTDAIERHMRQAQALGDTQARLPLGGIQPIKRGAA